MLNFQHSPNGNIRLSDGVESYFDSLAHFLLDWAGPYSGLPEGYIESQVDFEAGRASLYSANSQEAMPESLYDEIVIIYDNLGTILANKAAREAA